MDLETAFWWRWRRQVDAVRLGTLAGQSAEAATSLREQFFLLDNPAGYPEE